MSLPAHFIPLDSARELQPDLGDLVWLEHLVARVKCAAGEQVVAADSQGELRMLPRAAELPRRVHEGLACHAVANAATLTLPAACCHLLAINELSISGTTVRLGGELIGPVPGQAAPVVRGELVLRVDELLYALAQGSEAAWRRSEERIAVTSLLLPGDEPEALRSGQGWIVACALPPKELWDLSFSNDDWVKSAFYDCLRAGCSEADANKIPVPSRAMLEAELKARGYQLKGDTAWPTAESVPGPLMQAFGALTGRSLTLPPQADLPTYVRLARARVPSPPPRFSCTAPVVAPPRTPAPPPELPLRQKFAQQSPAAWTGDFSAPAVGTHSVPRPAPPVRPADPAPAAQPSWASDFADPPSPGRPAASPVSRPAPPAQIPAPPARRPQGTSTPPSSGRPTPPTQGMPTPPTQGMPTPPTQGGPAAQPDWMSDFQ